MQLKKVYGFINLRKSSSIFKTFIDFKIFMNMKKCEFKKIFMNFKKKMDLKNVYGFEKRLIDF